MTIASRYPLGALPLAGDETLLGFQEGRLVRLPAALTTASQAAAEAAQEAAETAEAIAVEAAANMEVLLAYLPTGAPRSSGLLFRSDGTLTGWTGNTGRWSASPYPAMPAFDRSAIVAQTPGGGADAGGNREGFLFKDNATDWYMHYDAGNGSGSDPGGPWRPQYAKSTDKGLSWAKLGAMDMGLKHGYDGGAYPSTAFLFMEKRGSTYYMHRLTAGAVSLNQISGQPYYSDIWTAPAITGPYTYVRQTLTATGGAFDAGDAYFGSIVYDNVATYQVFYGGTSGASYQIGRATGAAAAGPYTKTGTVGILPAAVAGAPENPDVWWHAGLNRWVMLTNQVSGIKTVRNRLFFSSSLTDWTKATYHDVTPIAPAFGTTAIGMSRAFRNAWTNTPEIDTLSNSLGSVPFVYDTDPTDTNHIGRKIYYSAYEPCETGLLSVSDLFRDNFTSQALGDAGGQNGWTDSSGASSKPQIIAGGILDMLTAVGGATGSPMILRDWAGRLTSIAQRSQVTIGAGAGVGHIYAYTPTPGIGTFFHCDAGTSNTTITVWSGAGETILATGAGVSAGSHVIESVYLNDTFYLYVDRVLKVSWTLSAPHQAIMAAGGKFGIRNGYGGATTRQVHTYSICSPMKSSDNPIYRPLNHKDFCKELAVRAPRPDAYTDLYYYLQSESSIADGYRLRLTCDGATVMGTTLYKRLLGAETALAASTGTRTQLSTPNSYDIVRIEVQANVHRVYINGEKQLEIIDATYTSGRAIAYGGQGEVDVRALHLRKNSVVTITGVTIGQVVTLRGPGEYPLATTTAVTPTVTLSTNHFPATSIDVNGVQQFAPSGGIWGGDEYAI